VPFFCWISSVPGISTRYTEPAQVTTLKILHSTPSAMLLLAQPGQTRPDPVNRTAPEQLAGAGSRTGRPRNNRVVVAVSLDLFAEYARTEQQKVLAEASPTGRIRNRPPEGLPGEIWTSRHFISHLTYADAEALRCSKPWRSAGSGLLPQHHRHSSA